jgi:hypothetical protein
MGSQRAKAHYGPGFEQEPSGQRPDIREQPYLKTKNGLFATEEESIYSRSMPELTGAYASLCNNWLCHSVYSTFFVFHNGRSALNRAPMNTTNA